MVTIYNHSLYKKIAQVKFVRYIDQKMEKDEDNVQSSQKNRI